MRICIDTAILLDILKDEFRPFQEKLYLALARREELVAPTVVYAELLPQFAGDAGQLDRFLSDHRITIQPLDLESAVAASKAWMAYLKRKSKVRCPACGRRLTLKAHFLSDFHIGGFALARSDAILTRDRGIYVKYFPGLAGYENCLESKE